MEIQWSSVKRANAAASTAKNTGVVAQMKEVAVAEMGRWGFRNLGLADGATTEGEGERRQSCRRLAGHHLRRQ